MANINKDEGVQEPIRVVFGDGTLGLHGRDYHYLFSYARGGLESLVTDGQEWLYRVPRPAFWRAVTDNDRGNGFPLRSGMWLGADMFIGCKDIAVTVDHQKIPMPIAPENNRYTGEERAQTVRILFQYETITLPAARVDVAYEVAAGGRITVQVHYYGDKRLPELPVFGLRFVMPDKAGGYRYEGLSGETYPDRMAGGIPGVYQISGLPVTKYLVPQDCNVHMNTSWLEVYRSNALNQQDKGKQNTGLRFSCREQKFAFSCIPYTPLELENATHQEELPAARRTVVSILGAVRGVGGIDSWGAEVGSAYRIDAGKDICFSFDIEGTGGYYLT